METRTFYADPRKIVGKQIAAFLLICIGAIFFVAMPFIRSPFGLSGWANVLLSGMVIPFGLFTLLTYSRYVNRSKPILIIDSDGIEVAEPMTYAVWVPWSQVETTHLKWDKRGPLRVIRYLSVQVTNPDALVGTSHSRWRNFFQRRNREHWGSPVFVLEDVLETPVEDVQIIIENHLYERRKMRESHQAVRQSDVPNREPLRIANR